MKIILNVAQYIIDSYKRITNEDIDELKLHKLLYFSQRECLAVMGTPLFEEDLEGWVHGPVSPLVRSHFEFGIGITVNTDDLSDTNKIIVNSVMDEYCQFASWKLRELSHNENSWINSRSGLLPNERGNNILSIEDIRKDSEKVEVSNELCNTIAKHESDLIASGNSKNKIYNSFDEILQEMDEEDNE